ncbi:MAG: VOC family protein [Bacteroidota bacterium]
MEKIEPTLVFDGNAEEAFNFYRSVFGGEFVMLQRFKDSPMKKDVPESKQDKIMYIALPIGKQTLLMGWDHLPSYGAFSKGNNFQLSLVPSSKEETKRIFTALAKGGEVKMPLQDTFWDAYYGSLKDKFGVYWLLNFPTK